MKKLCNVISVICILWFAFCNTIDYSKAFVANMHRNSIPISISAPSAFNSDDTINTIVAASEITESAIFCEYTSFINVAKTQYSIYASSEALKKTILLPGGERRISFGESRIVSNFNTDGAKLLRYTDLLCEITVQSISDLCAENNSDYATTFYIDSEDLEKFTSYLSESGFVITLITDSAAASYVNNRWDSFQCYCLFFMAVCALFHCFRKSKTIVVKKLSGYNLADIVYTEFGSSIAISSIGIVASLVGESLIFELRDKCGADYFLFSISNHVLLLALMLLCIIIPGCYSVFERSATDIKRMKFPKLMQVVSLLIKIIVCILVLSNTSNTISIGSTLKNLNIARNTMQPLAGSYSFRFNTASTSIDLNLDDVESKCSTLYNILEQNDDVICIFVDASNYINTTNNATYNVYINASYLDYSLVLDADSIRITADSIDGPTIFIPDDLYSTSLAAEYMSSFSQIFGSHKITVQSYKAGQLLPTYSPESGLALGGYAYNPILVVADPSCYPGAMLSAFSSANILFDIRDQGNVSVLWEAVTKAGLNIFISNLQTVDSIYTDAIQATKVLFIEQCLSTVVYILMYLFTALFHSTVYFSVNSKKIAIKKVAGYSNLDINRVELCGKVVLFFCLFLHGNYEYVDYRVLILMIAFDLVQFYSAELHFTQHKISNIIKGEDYLP